MHLEALRLCSLGQCKALGLLLLHGRQQLGDLRLGRCHLGGRPTFLQLRKRHGS